MPFRSFFSRANRDRFQFVLREEGLRVALGRARRFAGRSLRRRLGFGPRDGGFAAEVAYLTPFWRDMAKHDAFHVARTPMRRLGRPRIAMIGDLYLPQCRKYRVAQLAELWGGQGADYVFSHYADVPRSVSILQTATHVMFYRTQMDDRLGMYMYEARRLGLPVLYDLDDPLFSISAYETYANMKALDPSVKAHFLSEAPKYLGALNLADIVTVSTPGMVDHTRLYTGRPVYFRRNFADRETLEAGAAARAAADATGQAGAFRVAFASGSQGHEVDFALIADDIAGFLEAAPGRELVILGHFDPRLLPADLQDRVETHRFTGYAEYLETLASADCAVMPLTDDAFNRCKSGVRVIDAASVSVPSLVGTVGDMANIVRDGETGRVLDPGASWRAALEDLARDRGAARAMGRAARADLATTWTARGGLPVVEDAVIAWGRA